MSKIKGNSYRIEDGIAYFKLNTKEVEFLVDVEDISKVRQATWHSTKSNYIKTSKYPGHKGTLQLSHLISGITESQRSKGYVVDHINGDPLDNRKENLRICTQRENSNNRKRVFGPAMGLEPYKDGWKARIRIGKKYKILLKEAPLEIAAYASLLGHRLKYGEFFRSNEEMVLEEMSRTVNKDIKKMIEVHVTKILEGADKYECSICGDNSINLDGPYGMHFCAKHYAEYERWQRILEFDKLDEKSILKDPEDEKYSWLYVESSKLSSPGTFYKIDTEIALKIPPTGWELVNKVLWHPEEGWLTNFIKPSSGKKRLITFLNGDHDYTAENIKMEDVSNYEFLAVLLGHKADDLNLSDLVEEIIEARNLHSDPYKYWIKLQKLSRKYQNNNKALEILTYGIDELKEYLQEDNLEIPNEPDIWINEDDLLNISDTKALVKEAAEVQGLTKEEVLLFLAVHACTLDDLIYCIPDKSELK